MRREGLFICCWAMWGLASMVLFWLKQRPELPQLHQAWLLCFPSPIFPH